MKCLHSLFVSMLALALSLGASSPAHAEPGLLLIAHGSPSADWNKPVLDFGRRVAEEVKKGGRFKAVRTAMLESAPPNIPTAVAELEAAGCDRIVAVPLFIAPTGHTHFDVPAVLGIYSSPRTTAALAHEGAEAARPKVPIVLTQTMSEGDVLRKYVADQVRRLSRSPQDDAVVLLAHGDPEHDLLAQRLMRRLTTHYCGTTGINYGDWAFIGVGQEYLSQGVPAIQAALEHKKRVIVVGVYLSSSASKIHQRCVATLRQRGAKAEPFEKDRVVLSDEGIIGHPESLRWVLDTAYAALAPAQQKPLTR